MDARQLVGRLAQEAVDLGEHTLRGEIVDIKCYLGVMKPAHGKPHRSCAARCISGGIPPVLMVKDRDGDTNYLLLVSAEFGQTLPVPSSRSMYRAVSTGT